jgi:hypothetical protein
MSDHPTGQVVGLYHRRIGDITVTAVSDGYLDTPLRALRSVSEEEATERLRAQFQPTPPRVSINCFLVRTGSHIALIDTGAGNTMGPTLGWLPRSLEALGLARKDIDTICLTHIHPDHSNGLTAPDGAPFFPHVDLVVSEADISHWHDDAARARVVEDQQIRYFDGGRFIWGDVCHVPELQMANPDITMAFDTDSNAAAATRRRTLDMAATDRLLVAGMHLHFPGFVHIVRRGEGYEAIPESWRFEMN